MAEGNYDHPTYITRQMVPLGKITATSLGTFAQSVYPMDIMFRGFSVLVDTAGPAAAAMTAYSLNGTVTTSLAAVTIGTATAKSTFNSPDPNYLLPAGAQLYYVAGTDSTGVYSLTQMHHGSPSTGTWGAP
jgi:hypothetical protein